jgi:hypothetical protein
MESVRGTSGRTHTLSVSLETAAKIHRLAGDRPIYRVIDELVDQALNGSQARLGGGVSGTKSDKQSDSIKARLSRLFSTDRGRDILAKMSTLQMSDSDREVACDLFLWGDSQGILDQILIDYQARLNELLGNRIPLPSFDLKTAEA